MSSIPMFPLVTTKENLLQDLLIQSENDLSYYDIFIFGLKREY